jgi:hypothetical protein
MALLSATGLPLIVVITSIAVSEGRMLRVNAASLVAAGMLSVLFFPAVGLWRMRVAGEAVAITEVPSVEFGAEDPSGGSPGVDGGPPPDPDRADGTTRSSGGEGGTEGSQGG